MLHIDTRCDMTQPYIVGMKHVLSQPNYKIIMKMALMTLMLSLQAACSVNPTVAGKSGAYSYTAMRSDLDRRLPKLVKKYDMASVVLVVLEGDKVIYGNGFGYADKVRQKRATLNTVYRVGSITKLFTATAIMQLQEQGRLNIDEPLTAYLPEFTVNTPFGLDSITLRGMLSHYSGLTSDRQKGFAVYNAEATLIESMASEHVAYKPGTVHAYSNLSYGLLGLVIERVSGLSYEQYLQQHIFQPLGINSASLGTHPVPEFAVAHEDNIPKQPMEIRDRAAGDIRMSAADLAVFARAMLRYLSPDTNIETRLLSADSVHSMWQVQFPDAPIDGGIEMGLGWMLNYPSKGLRNATGIYWHNGSTHHYHSSLLLNTSDNLAVIALSNSSQGDDPQLGKLAESAMISAIRSKTGEAPRAHSPTSKPVSRFTDQQVDQLTGKYLGPGVGEFVIVGTNNRMTTTIDGQKFVLVPMDDGSISAKLRLFGLIPFPSGELREMRFRLIEHDGQSLISIDNGPVLAQKVLPLELPEALHRFTGQYRLVNPDEMHQALGMELLTLENVDGYLRAELGMEDDSNEFYIMPADNTRGTVTGYGRGQGDSVFFELDDNGGEHVQFSGLLFEKIPAK